MPELEPGFIDRVCADSRGFCGLQRVFCRGLIEGGRRQIEIANPLVVEADVCVLIPDRERILVSKRKIEARRYGGSRLRSLHGLIHRHRVEIAVQCSGLNKRILCNAAVFRIEAEGCLPDFQGAAEVDVVRLLLIGRQIGLGQ